MEERPKDCVWSAGGWLGENKVQFSAAWRRKTQRKGMQKCTAKGQEKTDLRATRGTDAHKEPNAVMGAALVALLSLEGSRLDRTPEALLSPLELAPQGRRLRWRPPRAPSTLCLSDIPKKTTKPISFPSFPGLQEPAA